MAKYKHNDYYGYINKVQERAISNPEWFWGETDDALQARDWLRNNGAQSIIDDIYKNTPDEMKMRIPTKMLSKETRENRVINQQREKTNNVAKKVAVTGAAIAGAPALITSANVAPFATGMNLISSIAGGYVGSILGSKIGEDVYSRSTASDGVGSSISTNKERGAEIGGLLGGLAYGAASSKSANMLEDSLLSKYGYENGLSFKDMLYELRHKGSGVLSGEYEGWYHPAERWTDTQRIAYSNQRTDWRDALSKLKDNYQKYTTQYDGFRAIQPEIKLEGVSPSHLKALPLHKGGPEAIRYNDFITAAEKANDYWKSQGSFVNKSLVIQKDPILAIAQSINYKPRITLDATKTYGESYNNLNHAVIGMKPDSEFGFPPIEIVGHELGHRNPLFNTRALLESMTDNQKIRFNDESPYYNMDYSRLTPRMKQLLKPIIGVNPHDFEYSEGYSDLFGMKTNMQNLGLGKNGKYTMLDLLRYKYTTPYGKRQRFLRQRPGLRRQVQALNESENWK